MADNIKLVVDAVNGTISNFESRRGEFESTFNAMKATIFDLAGTWKGAAESAYEGRFREMIANLQTINTDVDGAIGKMKLAINTYAEAEGINKGAAEAVNPGTASYVS